MLALTPASYASPIAHPRRMGWGNGPLSGNPGFHLGCRYIQSVSWSDNVELRTFYNIDAPRNWDFVNLWYPMGTQPTPGVPSTYTDWMGLRNMTDANAWAWMRGGTNDDYALGENSLIPTTSSHTPSKGCVLRAGQWPTLWGANNTIPVVVLLALNPPQISTKTAPIDLYFWARVARGDYNDVYDGLGFRFAYKDWKYNRQVFPAAGQLMAPAHITIVVGWENDSAQNWSVHKNQIPTPADAGFTAGQYQRDVHWAGIEQIVTSFKSGYHRFNGWTGSPAQKNCPYFFSARYRQAAPREAGTKIKDLFWNVSNPGILNCLGVSLHDNDDSFSRPCIPGDEQGFFHDKTVSGTLSFEGLDTTGELCYKHGWTMLCDETSPHYTGSLESGPYPDYFWLAVHRWLLKNREIAGGFSIFLGDATVDMINNPAPAQQTGAAIRHEITKKVLLNLFKYPG